MKSIHWEKEEGIKNILIFYPSKINTMRQKKKKKKEENPSFIVMIDQWFKKSLILGDISYKKNKKNIFKIFSQYQ